MADENYTLPEVPVYREAIRKILNEDPVNAEEILNPLVQALLENIHFVKLLTEQKAESAALDAHTGDDTAHLAAEERIAWNGKAEGDHRHTAEDVGALASDGTAAAAAKLATARTIRTNLASTSAVSFNGTANITPGVTGTLPIAHGGTGATTAAAALYALIYGAATLTAAALAPVDYIGIGDVSAGTGKKITIAELISFISSQTPNTGPNIVAGSYVGTGKYGINNPNSLSFSFAPKMIWFTGIDVGPESQPGYVPHSYLNCSSYHVNMEAVTTSYKLGIGLSLDTSGEVYGKKSSDGKTFFWYCPSNATAQGNASGKRQYYIAMG